MGAIFIVNFGKRVARKLCRIMLLHFGIVTFRFHFGRTRKPFISQAINATISPHALQLALASTSGDGAEPLQSTPKLPKQYTINLRMMDVLLVMTTLCKIIES